MIEYAMLILGIGLVVYNGMVLLMVAVDRFGAFMASRDAELIASLEEKQSNENAD